MTYPRPLSPEAAARAQAALNAGPGICQICHTPIWRYATSSDPDRRVMFTEKDGGSWDFPRNDTIHPVATFVGHGKGCLTYHNCIEDSE